MISLNLLSPEKKQEISRQMIFVALQRMVSWMLIAVCSAGIILLAAQLVMQNSFDQAVGQGALVTQEYGVLNQKVRLANQKVEFLSSIQNKFVIWSPRLSALSSLTPQGIELHSINANNISRDVQITGYAKTREDLLLYKQNLENSSIIKSVELPIENVLEPKDITFNIKSKLAL
jgi:Tfp pilus assembly protein PilN